MAYEICLFDLDGTIVDSQQGIVNSILHTVATFGLEMPSMERLKKFIGPPIRVSFEKVFNMSPKDANSAVSKYREYYAEKGVFENILYPGIEDTLKILKERGKTIALATLKPTVFAVKILEEFGISQYFTYALGSELNGDRNTKGEVISDVLDALGDISKEKTVMIGDREYDILGAREMGLSSIGVTYGFGSRRELEYAGADMIVDSVPELLDLV